MTPPLTYASVLERLAAAVPHVASVYEREVASWAPESPPPIVFVERWFTPYLIQQLESANELEVKRCLSFLEQLASSSDTALHDLVHFAVVEPLLSDSKAVELALSAAGPKVKKLIVRARNWTTQ